MNAVALPAFSLSGTELSAALRTGIYRLISCEEVINKINVFPVPDGDTGTNLALTLQAVLVSLRGNPDPPEGVIDRPLELETGGALRVKMRIVPEGRGLPSVTDYRVVRRAGDFALVELSPRTGRQHQIRAHLDAIGHPVVGDKLYGGDGSAFLAFIETGEIDPALLLARQALHAHRVAFDHPRTAERQSFVSPLPADLAEFLQGASP